MTVNIFEIYLEDYYLKKLTNIDNKMDLDGLIPSEQQHFTFEE